MNRQLLLFLVSFGTLAFVAAKTCPPKTPRCPPCPGPFQEYKLYNNCADRCKDPKNPLTCPNDPSRDTEACYCRSGYCRAANGTCVEDTSGLPAYETDKLPSCCNNNFEVATMFNGCYDACVTEFLIIDCFLGSPVPEENFEPGCFCKEGYCRDINTRECRPGKKNF